MGEDYRDISSAPRDGTPIEVTDHETCTAVMRWNKVGSNWLVSEQPGIWEAPDGSFTWCEDQGFGPTHWRPVLSEGGRELGQ